MFRGIAFWFQRQLGISKVNKSMDIAALLNQFAGMVWGLPLIFLLVGAGFSFTFYTKGIQFSQFRHGIQCISGKFDKASDPGEISHFQALSAALSATIGLGNIAGVAIAIHTGGPGAVFWMWVTGLVGMATKFVSCSLAVMFRHYHKDGSISGGPMYYIELGLGKKWKPLAVAFAFFGIAASFGIGNMFQSNQAAAILSESFSVPEWLTGITLVALVSLVIIGGIQRIGQVAVRLVPGMCLIYILGALYVLIINFERIPELFFMIFHDAFHGTAAIGGIAGIAFKEVVVQGVRRACFSNEAGMGSAPIAHAAAKTNEPIREGVVAMIGPFIDTIVVCTMTALVILITGAWTQDLNGIQLAAFAFDSAVEGFGKYIISIGVLLFAFSTMISWSYYGERCCEYLFGESSIMKFKVIFVVFTFIGAVWKLNAVLDFSDAMAGLMAIPNLIGIIFLLPKVLTASNDYFSRMK